jgi:hypothetical protein
MIRQVFLISHLGVSLSVRTRVWLFATVMRHVKGMLI